MIAGRGAIERLVLACAHRGDSSRFRENTLPALRSAMELGAEFVETDVRVTRDGRVVLIHDETLRRLWGVDKRVEDLDWADIAELGNAQDRIPLLADALELFRDSSSVLVVDMDEPGPADAAYDTVHASGVDVAWCGNLDAMRRVRSRNSAARIWLPWDRRVAPSTDVLKELRPEFVNSEYVVLNQQMVDEIHAQGARVSCWTVDDAAAMRWVLRLGVDSVTTNRLDLLRETIAEGSESWMMGRPVGRLAAGELSEAHRTARELAEWAIAFCRSADRGTVSTKANPADLVTEVDVAVERHVRDVVAERFPDHDFVGEEMGGRSQPGVPCWYLDPVDGTTNYVNRIPWSSFSLALAVDDVPYVAVVSDPWRGEIFEAVTGHGARLNGERLTMAPAGTGDPLTGSVVSTELAGHLPWPGMIQFLDALGDRHCIMRIMGSATLTVVGVAAGRGAGSVIGQFNAVDHVAAALIVQEAGGVVLDSHGRPNTFPASGGILVAVPAAADDLYALWRGATQTEQRERGRAIDLADTADDRFLHRFGRLDRNTGWTLVGRLPLDFPTFHPQGIAFAAGRTFLSSVEILEEPQPIVGASDSRARTAGSGVGHVFVLGHDGTLLHDIHLGEGAAYHPGGIDFDGEQLWVPIAQYRPDSASIVATIDPETGEVRERFRVSDHVGWLTSDPNRGLVYGGSWGSRRFYTWTTDGEEVDRWENPSSFIDYQDCQFVAPGRMLCSGIAMLYPGAAETRELGGLALVDMDQRRIVHEMPVHVLSTAGHVITRNPFAFSVDENRLTAWFAPDDGHEGSGTEILKYETRFEAAPHAS